MKLLTASLEGEALDWALAVALEKTPALSFERKVVVSDIMGWQPFEHTDPALCLWLIKSDIYQITHTHGGWEVFSDAGNRQFGESLEQAIARCVVAMRLGDEVDVPDELCGEQA